MSENEQMNLDMQYRKRKNLQNNLERTRNNAIDKVLLFEFQSSNSDDVKDKLLLDLMSYFSDSERHYHYS